MQEVAVPPDTSAKPARPGSREQEVEEEVAAASGSVDAPLPTSRTAGTSAAGEAAAAGDAAAADMAGGGLGSQHELAAHEAEVAQRAQQSVVELPVGERQSSDEGAAARAR